MSRPILFLFLSSLSGGDAFAPRLPLVSSNQQQLQQQQQHGMVTVSSLATFEQLVVADERKSSKYGKTPTALLDDYSDTKTTRKMLNEKEEEDARIAWLQMEIDTHERKKSMQQIGFVNDLEDARLAYLQNEMDSIQRNKAMQQIETHAKPENELEQQQQDEITTTMLPFVKDKEDTSEAGIQNDMHTGPVKKAMQSVVKEEETRLAFLANEIETVKEMEQQQQDEITTTMSPFVKEQEDALAAGIQNEMDTVQEKKAIQPVVDEETRIAFLANEIETTKREKALQQVDWQTKLEQERQQQQHQDEILGTEIQQLQQERDEFKDWIAAQFNELQNAQAPLMTPQMQQQQEELSRLNQESKVLKDDMMEMQCDDLRRHVLIERAQSNLKTIQQERMLEQHGKDQELAVLVQTTESGLARAKAAAKTVQAAVAKNHTVQLQSMEDTAIGLRNQIRESKFDIRNMDQQIVKLLVQEREQEQSLLKLTVWTMPYLITHRLLTRIVKPISLLLFFRMVKPGWKRIVVPGMSKLFQKVSNNKEKLSQFAIKGIVVMVQTLQKLFQNVLQPLAKVAWKFMSPGADYVRKQYQVGQQQQQ